MIPTCKGLCKLLVRNNKQYEWKMMLEINCESLLPYSMRMCVIKEQCSVIRLALRVYGQCLGSV